MAYSEAAPRPIGSMHMAKGQKRSNREIKKPKQAKQKISAAAASSQAKPGVFARGKKK